MNDYGVSWQEYIKVVQQVGHLKGAIEAHQIITNTDVGLGYKTRIQDDILYRIAREVDNG